MNTELSQQSLRAAVHANVRAALAEDLGSGDLSASLIAAERSATARIITHTEYSAANFGSMRPCNK